MKTFTRGCNPAHFETDFNVGGGFSSENEHVENNFQTAADLVEESAFQIEEEDDINNYLSLIYVHKSLFIASGCIINI